MINLSNKTLELMATALHEVYVRDELPGISAIVTRGHEIIWSNSHGYADLEAKRIANSDTIYHLGSVTKVFTAIMLMQLRDAGKLRLDDPLDKYLPEIKKMRHPPITLRQLASHTSGFPLMPPLDELTTVMQEFPPRMETLREMKFPTIAQIFDCLPQVELLSPPGTQVAYSNLGIALLAHALERVAGQNYTSYIEKQILYPLSMENSGFSSTAPHSANIATCYLPFSSPPQVAPFETKMINGFTATGALWSSANDMFRFMALLTSPQNTALLPIVSQSSLREMCQMIAPLESSQYTEAVTASGVGIGWFLSQIQGHLVAEHGGADPSTAAYIAWVPTLDLAAFAATNTGKNPTAVAVTLSTLLELVIDSLRGS